MDLEKIKKLAKIFGLRPSAAKGQNFLVDKEVLDKVAAIVGVDSNDNILEIGPGFGILTERLLAAKKVVSVELDNRLFSYLEKKFAKFSNLELINSDILRLENYDLAKKFTPEDDYRLVANIPYHITGKILRKFVSDTNFKPGEAIFLVQKEVGERVCAQPPNMNLLALSVQLYAEPEIKFAVGKESFWPQPKVDSVCLKINNINNKVKYPIQDMPLFWRLLKIGFSSPRKQLHNNIKNGFKIDSDLLFKVFSQAGINNKVRAQELEIEQWIFLQNKLF